MGFLEIAIVALILLIFFGYKKLPALGRSAGEGAKQLKGSAQEVVGDKLDPSTLGRSAGKGVRELREFKDAVTGSTPASPSATPSPKPKPEPEQTPQPGTGEAPPAPEQAERVEGELVEPDQGKLPARSEPPA